MIRQLFTAASSVRLARPVSSTTTTLKSQIARQPTWRLTVRQTQPPSALKRNRPLTQSIQNTAPLSLRTARPFSSTLSTPFTSTTSKSSSPFRLSSDKVESHENPNDAYYSPYKPKRQWPPDMSKLSPKHQFRLERKYRRRAALKYARPKFIKIVTLSQWAIIGCEWFVDGFLPEKKV